MEQAREELAEFRRNMEGLVKQMDGISVDLVSFYELILNFHGMTK